MVWPTERATEHIEQLAGKRGIAIHWTENPPKAYSTHSVAWCNPPTTGARYLFALHEMGHCASKVARSWEQKIDEKTAAGRHADVLCEAAAWAWAAEMADPEMVALIPKRERNQIAAKGFGSYLWYAAESATA